MKEIQARRSEEGEKPKMCEMRRTKWKKAGCAIAPGGRNPTRPKAMMTTTLPGHRLDRSLHIILHAANVFSFKMHFLETRFSLLLGFS